MMLRVPAAARRISRLACVSNQPLPTATAVQGQLQCAVFQGTSEKTEATPIQQEMPESAYHDLADAWIGSLEEALEALDDVLDDFDINNAQGVLNLQLGEHGTYVINKQAPNREIWWSSPVSGPKRFAWDSEKQEWLGTRDGAELLSLLQGELEGLFPGFDLEAGEVRQEALTRMAAL